MFSTLVSHIEQNLNLHHNIYELQCKAEYWEELLSKCLILAGFGSDWKPDSNHKSGLDQTTNCKTKIGNKTGTINNDYVEISGSRLGKHTTLEDKLNFLSIPKEDYIFCLSVDKKEWERGIKRYYFIIFDSNIFDYHKQNWERADYARGPKVGIQKGWKCSCDKYDARIVESMSSQLWTNVKLDCCEEFYEITIG